jgi:hypothetical protein
MSSQRSEGRAHVCSYTFSDGRRCRALRYDHALFCPAHARKEARAYARDLAAEQIARCLPSGYLSANDLAAALSRLFSAVAHGDIPPNVASTLAYLGQTLAQTLPLAAHEYTSAFGSGTWRRTIADSFASRDAEPAPKPEPPRAFPNPLPPTLNEFRSEVLVASGASEKQNP